MVAKPGFEEAISHLEKEREIHRADLIAFESGALSIMGQTVPDFRFKDETPARIAWLKAKIEELTALIAQHSIPAN